jgi:hypothetical protein
MKSTPEVNSQHVRRSINLEVLRPHPPRKMAELLYFYLSNNARPRLWSVPMLTESLQEKSLFHIPGLCF